MTLTVTGLDRYDSSVCVLTGDDEAGREHLFACESRFAPDILEAVESGDEVVVYVEPWQLFS